MKLKPGYFRDAPVMTSDLSSPLNCKRIAVALRPAWPPPSSLSRVRDPHIALSNKIGKQRSKPMRRFTMLTICLLALASLVTTTAWAGPHYQNNSVSAAIQSNGNLIVSWQEAGLGFTNIDYSLTADVSTTF